MTKKLYTTGAKWEDIVGYCRAVQVGNVLEISGTTAAKDGEILFKGDAYGQAKYIIELASQVLQDAGGSLKDVIRTRMYVTDVRDWQKVGKAHGEFFAEIKPASTMVEVSALVDPDMLVEIEFSAILNS